MVFSGALAEVLEADTPKDKEESQRSASGHILNRLANEWKKRARTHIQQTVRRDATAAVVDTCTASWLGRYAVTARPLGVQTFGQSGDLVDLSSMK